MKIHRIVKRIKNNLEIEPWMVLLLIIGLLLSGYGYQLFEWHVKHIVIQNESLTGNRSIDSLLVLFVPALSFALIVFSIALMLGLFDLAEDLVVLFRGKLLTIRLAPAQRLSVASVHRKQKAYEAAMDEEDEAGRRKAFSLWDEVRADVQGLYDSGLTHKQIDLLFGFNLAQ